jgi:hypothetical protein
MSRRLGILSFVLMLAVAGSAVAQQRATLLLNSGERVSGDLVDLGGVGFTINVNGTERRIPTGEVVVIDFGGDARNFPASELNRLGSGQAVVLTSGEVVQGRLDDIGGTRPLRLTVNLSSGGSHDYTSNEVRRVYLSKPSTTAVPTPPVVGPSAAGIPVPANQGWVDTGITVRRGQRVTFTASGEVQLSSDANDKASPAGSLRGRYPSGPMRQYLAGALIGRIGTGTMFGIGDQTVPLPMPADGRLFLGVNDDGLQDNQGQFLVQVRPGSVITR